MKKLVLTLSSLVLSTTLFAQSYETLTAKLTDKAGESTTFAYGDNNGSEPQQAYNRNQNTGLASAYAFAAGSVADAGSEATSSEADASNQVDASNEVDASYSKPSPPHKLIVANRSYSIRGGVSYHTSAGFRIGPEESGLSVKHFTRNNHGIEGTLTSGWFHRGIRVTGLRVTQKPLGNDGFFWYWGVGGHVGRYDKRYWNGNADICNDGRYESYGKSYNCNGSRTVAGVDAMAGIEHHFADAPFTLSIDVRPTVDLVGRSRNYGDAAVSLRYAF